MSDGGDERDDEISADARAIHRAGPYFFLPWSDPVFGTARPGGASTLRHALWRRGHPPLTGCNGGAHGEEPSESVICAAGACVESIGVDVLRPAGGGATDDRHEVRPAERLAGWRGWFLVLCESTSVRRASRSSPESRANVTSRFFRDLGLQPDRRGERRGDEAGLLGLLEHPQRALALRSRRHQQARPEHDLAEARPPSRRSTTPSTVSSREMKSTREACATARSVNAKQVATAASRSCSGLQASPGPSNSAGGGRGHVGKARSGKCRVARGAAAEKHLVPMGQWLHSVLRCRSILAAFGSGVAHTPSSARVRT